MNKKIIIGNLKMNMLPTEFLNYINQLKDNVKLDKNKIILCVPYTNIPYISGLLKNTNIYIASQNVYYESEGAYTGEISTNMLKSIGVEYVLLGHPERRHIFKEPDKIINKKIIQVLSTNLKVILCIENIKQLKKDLKNVRKEQLENIIFVYEEFKLIGKKEITNSQKIIKIINKYKKYILKKYNNVNEANIKIGYGGSIKNNNIKKLSNIEVLLIGSACLNIEEFINIINNTQGEL